MLGNLLTIKYLVSPSIHAEDSFKLFVPIITKTIWRFKLDSSFVLLFILLLNLEKCTLRCLIRGGRKEGEDGGQNKRGGGVGSRRFLLNLMMLKLKVNKQEVKLVRTR